MWGGAAKGEAEEPTVIGRVVRAFEEERPMVLCEVKALGRIWSDWGRLGDKMTFLEVICGIVLDPLEGPGIVHNTKSSRRLQKTQLFSNSARFCRKVIFFEDLKS